MNLIKTDIRSSLPVSRLDDIMMIALNGPALENEEQVQVLLEKVFDYWMLVCCRNVRKSYRGRRPRAPTNVQPSAVELLNGPADSEAESEVSSSESESDVEGSEHDVTGASPVRLWGSMPLSWVGW